MDDVHVYVVNMVDVMSGGIAACIFNVNPFSLE